MTTTPAPSDIEYLFSYKTLWMLVIGLVAIFVALTIYNLSHRIKEVQGKTEEQSPDPHQTDDGKPPESLNKD